MFVSQAEYFWDTDPGAGNGIPVLATDGNFNSAFEQLTKTGIATPGNGLHKFSIRIKDNTGVWGPVFTNVIDVQQNQSSTLIALAQAEYFWDTDPGAGNGTPVLAADGNFNSVFEELTKTGITTPGNGLHKFSVRIKDNTGVWGPVFTNVIDVQQNPTSTLMALSQAEYFWDTDPGAGNGTPVLAADGNFDSSFEQLTKTGIASPSSGLHVFNIRIKDNAGVWGPVFRNVINVETQIPTGCWQSINAGLNHSMGIKTDGTLWVWGDNRYGQLGDGTTIERNTPIQIGIATDWQSINGGYSHTLAIKTDGTLWAWGDNRYGQLGDGTKINRFTPIQIGTATDWKSIRTSGYQTLAIKNNGTLWGWGYNYWGSLGDGTNIDKLVPTQIGIGTNWKSVELNSQHSLGLKTDGTLWAWGLNFNGRLGDGTQVNKLAPVQIGFDTNWQSISAGDDHSVGSKTDGTLWAWGGNSTGHLGDGTIVEKFVPTQIGTATNWQNVAGGTGITFASKTDGTLWSWGNNSGTSLGHGSINGTSYFTSPKQVGSYSDTMQISLGYYYSLVKNNNGDLKVCGQNSYGQLGDGTGYSKNMFTPINCPLNCPPPTQFSTTGVTSTTATINWTASTPGPNGGYMYFYSTHPVVGGIDGTTFLTKAPLTNLLPSTTYYWWVASDCKSSEGNWISGGSFTTLPTTETGCWYSVSSGNRHSAGIKTDGTLWTWGNNDYGQLGVGITNAKNKPIQVGGMNNWLKTDIGYYHTVAIKTDGTLWTWGKNDYGQLGDGTTTNRATPTQIGTAADWVNITTGEYYTLALKSNGTLWAWGRNNKGQLGDGTIIDKNIPIQIGTANNWKMISSGREHTLAIKIDGTLWAWGDNWGGKLGDGTGTARTSPVQIGTNTNWQYINAGYSHSIALKTNGTLWAWGRNTAGQLGDGTITDRGTPMQIGTETNWKSVGAGDDHSAGLKTDGTLWAWGYNNNGELGDGTKTNKLTPTQIGTASDKQSITVGIGNVFVINTAGFLTATGSNGSGEIGDGTFISKNIFVPVGCPTSTVLRVDDVSTQSDQLKVYPNPVQDYVTVSFDQKILLVTVYNAAGQLIVTKAINDIKGTIDFSALPSGVYLVKVNAANDFVKTVKVIKR
ncbi:hypothetical protein C1638_003675 [Chryseobacterium oncorhynchi]|uniref:Fibronectin type-III domain-containing protein n=1 Tax=Chryseobacterium oncorhynchi TaxID=741074 RepID=A0A316X2E8_9FLAO|nr:hypothetical protein C1638_003675 [Chryseobacterium oncorhynchi]